MNIPVEVQQPNRPQTRRVVGHAPDTATAAEVAKLVGMPDGCLIDGKIMSRNGVRRSLVGNIRFDRPAREGDE